MRWIIAAALIAFGAFYGFVQTRSKPVAKLAPLPPPVAPLPPPPPPPPPALSPQELEQAERRLFDLEPAVRIETCRRLAAHFNPGIDALLLRQLQTDSEPLVRVELVGIAAARKPPGEDERRAAERISPALLDSAPEVRIAGVQALRQLNARSAVDRLTMLLFDTSVEVRRETIATLNALADARPEVRKAAEISYRVPAQYQQTYQEALAHARRGAAP